MATLADDASRLGRLEGQMGELSSRLARLEGQVSEISSRLARLEGRVDEISKVIQDLRAGQRQIRLALIGIGAAHFGLLATLLLRSM